MEKKRTRKQNNACPLMNNPADDCFCVKTDGRYIEQVFNFCGGNYLQCEIYRGYGAWKMKKERDNPD